MLEDQLTEIVEQTDFVQEVLDVAESEFDHYYIGAGCITQSVWNYLCGREAGYGIGDIDIVYYDAHDHTGEREDWIEAVCNKKLEHAGYPIDVTNEARVHVWYEKKFGKKIPPYQSVEEAIDTWPATASAIGVKKTNGIYQIYAPYGLDDLFQLIVRPNKKMIPQHVYEKKVSKWKRLWPELKIQKW
ncbi:nucleotidyltransferase family protein [Halobacillus campisalis]|uniref:Nucleotidyltransferase family protein n=1 Tax=Halobacillus campisalis TaxID=435909 RepID=A0ABW2K2Z7_9BACI|nr:nucleotidyltransferase family protein [Halobacillus campisalis]